MQDTVISPRWKQSCLLDAIIIIYAARALQGFTSHAAKLFLIYLLLMVVYVVSVNVIVTEKIAGNLQMQVT